MNISIRALITIFIIIISVFNHTNKQSRLNNSKTMTSRHLAHDRCVAFCVDNYVDGCADSNVLAYGHILDVASWMPWAFLFVRGLNSAICHWMHRESNQFRLDPNNEYSCRPNRIRWVSGSGICKMRSKILNLNFKYHSIVKINIPWCIAQFSQHATFVLGRQFDVFASAFFATPFDQCIYQDNFRT